MTENLETSALKVFKLDNARKLIAANFPREVAASVPLLFISGARPLSVLIFAITVLLALNPVFWHWKSMRQDFSERFVYFTVSLSIIALTKVLLESGKVFVCVSTLYFATLLLVGRFNQRPSKVPATTQSVSCGDQSDTFLFSASIAIVMAVLGWTSVVPYALGLALGSQSRKIKNRVVAFWATLLVVTSGMVCSFVVQIIRPAEKYLSFDQLFRSVIGESVFEWGINENIGAIGYNVRYHWLGEAVSALLARICATTSIQSVTILVPIIAVIFCFSIFDLIGRDLRCNMVFRTIATILTITICGQFDPFSIGSLWGYALFLTSVWKANLIWSKLRRREPINVEILWLIALTPLVMLSQSSLGLVMCCICAIAFIFSTTKFKMLSAMLGLLVAVQAVVGLVVLQVFLTPTVDNIYDARLSVRNLLRFRGLDIYFGENRFYIYLVSTLFLVLVGQMLSGLVLAKEHLELREPSVRFFVVVCPATLLLANLFDVGGKDAQQLRFLDPLIILGTWLGCLSLFTTIIQEYRVQQKQVKQLGWALFIAIVGAFLAAGYLIWGLEFGLTQKRAKLLFIAVSSGISLVVIFIVLTSRSNTVKKFLAVAAVGALVLVGHVDYILDLPHIHLRSVSKDISEMYTGSIDAVECFDYAKSQTDRRAVFASNWFELPLSTRDMKYFLVSASIGRRMLVDGPDYIANPWPLWLEERVRNSITFAIQPTYAVSEYLKKQHVDYFIVNRGMTNRGNWAPFASVKFARSECLVLRLQ